MNRFILSILAISFPLQLLGQMFPLSDHYVNDALDINPAFAGCHDALSANIMYHPEPLLQYSINQSFKGSRNLSVPFGSPA